jgi:hypothetical protein
VGNFLSDFYSAPGCSSTTDLNVYANAGLPGVELAHIGNPKKHHTALDRGATRIDLVSAGRILAVAIANYPAERLFPVMPHYVSVGFAILELL